MSEWFFVSDLHGCITRFQKLFQEIRAVKPAVVLMGGDLFPSGFNIKNNEPVAYEDFLHDILLPGFLDLMNTMGDAYPRVFLILGNDDRKIEEAAVVEAEKLKVWNYLHNDSATVDGYTIFGYACVPPTPFLLKDWERYDVSRYVPPGSVSPEEGYRTVKEPANLIKYSTIKDDLDTLCARETIENQPQWSKSIFLFHSPPYQSNLDRAALDGMMIDFVPLNVNVGSVAIQRLIKECQPLVSLHGHIHESARLTGHWKEKTGECYSFTAAHDGPELALVHFNPTALEDCWRELL
jgi:uncharacterized protein